MDGSNGAGNGGNRTCGGWLFRLIMIVLLIVVVRGIITHNRQGKTSSQETKESSRAETTSAYEPSFTFPSYEPETYTVPSVIVPEGVPVVEYDFYDLERYRADLSRALDDRPERICVKGHVFDKMQELYNTEYGAFWVKGFHYYRQDDYSSGEQEIYLFLNMIYYDLTEGQIASMKGEIDRAADAILAKIPYGADRWTAAKVIHEELVTMITYDHSLMLPHTHDLYGALVTHDAVCSAYASAFYFLMCRLGYTSEASYSDTHSWNIMAVPALEQFVDVTWDDPDMWDRYGRPYIKYDYFFLPYEEVKQIEDHDFANYIPMYEFEGYLEDYNYHARQGFYLNSYDRDRILALLKTQMDSGTNLLTLRFGNSWDYRRAFLWFDQNCREMNQLLSEIGYREGYYYWYNDTLQVISIGLYPPAFTSRDLPSQSSEMHPGGVSGITID